MSTFLFQIRLNKRKTMAGTLVSFNILSTLKGLFKKMTSAEAGKKMRGNTEKMVLGELEHIYLPPLKSAFSARVDTGAVVSSLDAADIEFFEEKKQVSFTVVNRETQEKHTFRKEVIRNTSITRVYENEVRPVVEMEVKLGGEKFKAEFTLADRRKFQYQMLLGRNILGGRAVVDVSVKNVLG